MRPNFENFDFLREHHNWLCCFIETTKIDSIPSIFNLQLTVPPALWVIERKNEFLRQTPRLRTRKSISTAGGAHQFQATGAFPRFLQWPFGIWHYLPGNDNLRCVSRTPAHRPPLSETPSAGSRDSPCRSTSGGSDGHGSDIACGRPLPGRPRHKRTSCKQKLIYEVVGQQSWRPL